MCLRHIDSIDAAVGGGGILEAALEMADAGIAFLHLGVMEGLYQPLAALVLRRVRRHEVIDQLGILVDVFLGRRNQGQNARRAFVVGAFAEEGPPIVEQLAFAGMVTVLGIERQAAVGQQIGQVFGEQAVDLDRRPVRGGRAIP